MSFVDTFDNLSNRLNTKLENFIQIISPLNKSDLESIVSESTRVTRKNFGKTMRLFAPLYLSNECVNNCTYCGFSRDNPILRVTLTVDQVLSEAKHLHSQGFRSILLVAGEHPKFVSSGYIEECIFAIKDLFPSIALEIAPMKEPEYISLVNAGCEALVVILLACDLVGPWLEVLMSVYVILAYLFTGLQGPKPPCYPNLGI